MSDPSEQLAHVRTLRPSLGSYLGFCGIWVVLALGYLGLWIGRPGPGLGGGVILAGSVALLSLLWMGGHRIRLGSGALEYRTGFFRVHRVSLNDIAALTTEHQGLSIVGRTIRFPRLRVVTRSGAGSFDINPKPFGRKALASLREFVSL
jgi:hypothetical protein